MTTIKHLDKYDCIKLGDWVRFMQSGQLVIGEVEYIIETFPRPGPDFVTDVGVVRADSILEHRHQFVPDSD